jgi:hypothetical protein
MADVFISYSTKDKPTAQRLAGTLMVRGLSVWWDTELVGGERFREVIVQQLEAAKVIMVLWSPSSVQSRFVIDEADQAAATGKLISVLLDGLPPNDMPLGFRGLQGVRLEDEPGMARALQRAGLKLSPAMPEQTPQVPPIERVDQVAREEQAWKFVLAKRDAKLAANFKREFPNSKHSFEAETRAALVKKENFAWGMIALCMIIGTAIGAVLAGFQGAFLGWFLGAMCALFFLPHAHQIDQRLDRQDGLGARPRDVDR